MQHKNSFIFFKFQEGVQMKFSGNVREITCTQTAFARAIGLTNARVNQMVKEGIVVCDDGARGGVLLFESLQNYWCKDKDESGVDFAKEHARLEKLKADKAEILLEKAKNQLYDASDIEYAFSSMGTKLRNQLQGLPAKIANTLPSNVRADVSSIMSKEIEFFLKELSSSNPLEFVTEDNADEE